jgi:hypothetical protein
MMMKMYIPETFTVNTPHPAMHSAWGVVVRKALSQKLPILLVMYGPAADVKEKSPVARFG